jgi:hypothetical protein
MQSKMLGEVLEFSDQVCLLLLIFVDLIRNKCKKLVILLKKIWNFAGAPPFGTVCCQKSFKWLWESDDALPH